MINLNALPAQLNRPAIRFRNSKLASGRFVTGARQILLSPISGKSVRLRFLGYREALRNHRSG